MLVYHEPPTENKSFKGKSPKVSIQYRSSSVTKDTKLPAIEVGGAEDKSEDLLELRITPTPRGSSAPTSLSRKAAGVPLNARFEGEKENKRAFSSEGGDSASSDSTNQKNLSTCHDQERRPSRWLQLASPRPQIPSDGSLFGMAAVLRGGLPKEGTLPTARLGKDRHFYKTGGSSAFPDSQKAWASRRESVRKVEQGAVLVPNQVYQNDSAGFKGSTEEVKEAHHFVSRMINDLRESIPEQIFLKSAIPAAYHILLSSPIKQSLEPQDSTRSNDGGHTWEAVVFPTRTPSERQEVLHLACAIEAMLADRWRKIGDGLDERKKEALRGNAYTRFGHESDIWDMALSEIIRQVYVHCEERGLLLEKVRREWVGSWLGTRRLLSGLQKRSSELQKIVDAQKRDVLTFAEAVLAWVTSMQSLMDASADQKAGQDDLKELLGRFTYLVAKWRSAGGALDTNDPVYFEMQALARKTQNLANHISTTSNSAAVSPSRFRPFNRNQPTKQDVDKMWNNIVDQGGQQDGAQEEDGNDEATVCVETMTDSITVEHSEEQTYPWDVPDLLHDWEGGPADDYDMLLSIAREYAPTTDLPPSVHAAPYTAAPLPPSPRIPSGSLLSATSKIIRRASVKAPPQVVQLVHSDSFVSAWSDAEPTGPPDKSAASKSKVLPDKRDKATAAATPEPTSGPAYDVTDMQNLMQVERTRASLAEQDAAKARLAERTAATRIAATDKALASSLAETDLLRHEVEVLRKQLAALERSSGDAASIHTALQQMRKEREALDEQRRKAVAQRPQAVLESVQKAATGSTDMATQTEYRDRKHSTRNPSVVDSTGADPEPLIEGQEEDEFEPLGAPQRKTNKWPRLRTKLHTNLRGLDTKHDGLLEIVTSGEYTKFIGELRPKSKNWLLKTLRDIWKEKAADAAVGNSMRMPDFLISYHKNHYGTKYLAETYLISLLSTAVHFRNWDLRADLFLRFVEEYWPLRILHLYLATADMLDQSKVGVVFPSKPSDVESPKYADVRACDVIALAVFGERTPAAHQRFMTLVMQNAISINAQAPNKKDRGAAQPKVQADKEAGRVYKVDHSWFLKCVCEEMVDLDFAFDAYVAEILTHIHPDHNQVIDQPLFEQSLAHIAQFLQMPITSDETDDVWAKAHEVADVNEEMLSDYVFNETMAMDLLSGNTVLKQDKLPLVALSSVYDMEPLRSLRATFRANYVPADPGTDVRQESPTSTTSAS